MASIFGTEAQAIVVPVNTVGAMGAGLALGARKKYGDKVYNPYRAACALGYLEAGDEGVAQAMTVEVNGKSIILAPTKEDWRDPSHLTWVRGAMQAIAREAIENNITSVAIPALGCGEGGLDWNEVRPIIEAKAEQLVEMGVAVEVIDPNGKKFTPGATQIPLGGGFVLTPISNGKVPNDALYCGRGKGGAVGDRPGEYGWLGNPVKFGNNAPACPLCLEHHQTAAETLPCYGTWLKHRLNRDKPFRSAFVQAMSSHQRLACFCTSSTCHTSIMAEVFSEWRAKVAASRTAKAEQEVAA
jgi:O-acetyl-ADP-ribose deacetylase (regulator of RNase III)